MLRRSHCTIQFAAAALLVCGALAAHGGMFGKDSPVPQWGLDAAKTPTPGLRQRCRLGDSLRRIPGDHRRRRAARWSAEREAIRILKPQGAQRGTARSRTTSTKRSTTSASGPSAPTRKHYQAKDTDFADVGDTSDSNMLSTEKARIVASTRCRCGRHDRLRVRRADGAMEAGKDLGDSERDSRRIRGS